MPRRVVQISSGGHGVEVAAQPYSRKRETDEHTTDTSPTCPASDPSRTAHSWPHRWRGPVDLAAVLTPRHSGALKQDHPSAAASWGCGGGILRTLIPIA